MFTQSKNKGSFGQYAYYGNIIYKYQLSFMLRRDSEIQQV